MTATRDDQGNWINSQGQPVPPKYIDKTTKQRDRAVRQVHRQSKTLSVRMVAVKAKVLEIIDRYLDQVAERHGEAWKGNAELVTFDGTLKVEVKISEALELDERLQVAKQKIDDCLRRWSEDSRQELRTVVNHAFNVDSKGRINVRNILTLRTLKFKDQVWQDAMGLISDSLRVRSTRRYINVYERDASGKWVIIPLNWSAI